MRISYQERSRRLVEVLQIGDDPPKGRIGLGSFQVSDVLADENVGANIQRHGILEVSTDGQNRSAWPGRNARRIGNGAGM